MFKTCLQDQKEITIARINVHEKYNYMNYCDVETAKIGSLRPERDGN